MKKNMAKHTQRRRLGEKYKKYWQNSSLSPQTEEEYPGMGNDGSIDLNGTQFNKENLEKELKNDVGIIGSEVTISDIGMIDIVPTELKEDILSNPMLPVSEEILTQALFPRNIIAVVWSW